MKFWIKAAVIGVGVGYAAFYFQVVNGLAPGDVRTSLAVVAQISGTMLGFVLAALAILATVANTKLLRNMQRTGHYQYLLRRMLGTTVTFGALMLLAIGSIFLPVIPQWLVYCSAGVAAFALTALADVYRKLWLVLSSLHPAAQGNEPSGLV